MRAEAHLGKPTSECLLHEQLRAGAPLVLWSLDMTSASTASLGSSAHFFRQLHNQDFSIVKHLSKDFIWRAFIAGWANSQQQQDVVEFASFFCRRHSISLVAGEWEARTNVHGVGQPGDAGLSAQPLLLHLPNIPPGLAPQLQVQTLVDQWYAQEAIHAFTVHPQCSCYNLEDFKFVPAGYTRFMLKCR